MASDGVEIRVGVEQLSVGLDGHDSHQAINEPPHGLSAPPAQAIEGGRLLIVRQASNGQKLAAEEEPPESP